MIDLIRQVTDESEVQELSRASEIGAVKIEHRLIEKEIERLRGDIEARPRLNTENVNDDLKFKLGEINALKTVLRLPQAAKEKLTNAEKE